MKKYAFLFGVLFVFVLSCSKFNPKTYLQNVSNYVNKASMLFVHLDSALVDTTLSIDQLKQEYDNVGKQLQANYKEFENLKKEGDDILYPVVKQYFDTLMYVYNNQMKEILSIREQNPNLKDINVSMKVADLKINYGLSLPDLATKLGTAIDKFREKYKINKN